MPRPRTRYCTVRGGDVSVEASFICETGPAQAHQVHSITAVSCPGCQVDLIVPFPTNVSIMVPDLMALASLSRMLHAQPGATSGLRAIKAADALNLKKE
jgi:hypothetical protein